ncbi:hypothetical protein ACVDG3_05345 [Meridianimarinicoccus sp. RP-17]|uniref:hypothetical protein n=1 Tax=Meridianimarinicoccus zhengii TaxID=2056810 RepID=UPI000DAF3CB6|nr:hypothetical protein [Phycocomes zhengii]
MSAFPADLPRGWTARTLALGLGVTILAGAAGFVAGHMRAKGQVTHLTIATCGLDAAPAPVALPLRDLMRKAGGHNVSLGPFRHDGLDSDVTVRFALGSDTPQRHGNGSEGELLVLPVPEDGTPLPDEIRLECRYGVVARVQYRTGATREAFDLTAPAAMADRSAG